MRKVTYIKHTISTIFNVNKIVTLYLYNFKKGFDTDKPEKHSFWEMIYVRSGEVIAVCDEKEHYLKSGDVLFHKPNSLHYLKGSEKSDCSIFIITFVCNSKSMSFFSNFTKNISKQCKEYIYTIIEESFSTFQMGRVSGSDSIFVSQNAPVGGQQVVKTHLELLLIRIIREESRENPAAVVTSSEAFNNKITSEIIRYLDSKIYEDFSIGMLCEYMHYGKTFLSTRFKDVTGHTIIEYYTILKIEEAKKMISTGGHTIDQIASLLNFNNQYYFSRVFKKITDCPPSEYNIRSKRKCSK